MPTRAELTRRFYIAFDEQILRRLALHIHDGYADACERAADLDDSDAHWRLTAETQNNDER